MLSPVSAETNVGWGGKLNNHLMASFVRNICTKNYQNLITGFQVTVKNVGMFFLRPSVIHIIHSEKLTDDDGMGSLRSGVKDTLPTAQTSLSIVFKHAGRRRDTKACTPTQITRCEEFSNNQSTDCQPSLSPICTFATKLPIKRSQKSHCTQILFCTLDTGPNWQHYISPTPWQEVTIKPTPEPPTLLQP